MSQQHTFGFTTRQLHAGQQPDPSTGSRAVPIYQTTSYVFSDTEHAARLFALQELGNIYTRIMNPTSDVFEQRLADLEGGVGALAASSGHAAQTMAILTLCQAGDHIVSASTLYGGTYNQFDYTFPRLGIDVTFVDPSDPENFRRAIRPNTKIIYGETLGNPRINVFPFEEVAAIAREYRHPADDRQHLRHALPVPALRVGREHCGPFDHQVHRRARHQHRRRHCGRRQLRLGGQPALPQLQHARSQLPRPGLCRPGRAGLHPQGAGAGPARHRRLPVAVQLVAVPAGAGDAQPAHGPPCAATRSRWPRSWRGTPRWPGSPTPACQRSPTTQRAKKYLPKGPGAILGFGIKGGLEAGRKFIDNLKLFSHLANVGDAKSLAIHPASTTHSQLTPEEQAGAGVTPDFVRLSIGLEDIEDILWDLSQALEKA